MHAKTTFISTLFICATITTSGYAQDAQTAIERVGQAYNIEALHNADTIRIESDIRLPFASHDYSATFHDLAKQRFHTILDVKNQRGSSEFLTTISRTAYHGRYLFKDGKSQFIAYGPDTYIDNDDTDFFTQFGGSFRSSDVLLSLWITRPENETRYVGKAMWLGHWQDIVEVGFPNSAALKVFIRRKDGAITKMERNVGDNQTLSYTFHEHEKKNGGMIAREHSFFIGNEHVYYSFNRDVDVNDRRDKSAFKMDKDIIFERERTDQSEMQVRSVGENTDPNKNLFQTCEGESCTTFKVIGNGVVGFGLGEGLAARLAAYREKTGVTLPLTYMIASDHHQEGIGGAADAQASGATLLVTADTADVLGEDEVDYDIEVVSETNTFADLTVLPVGTDHASTVLIAYDSDQKVLMQTGHYYSSFVEGPSYARHTAVSLYNAIPDPIRDEAVAIISGEDLKVEEWSDFLSAIENHEDIQCHRSRRICGS